MKYYAGIGSRETPKFYCDLFTKIALYLDGKDYTLRSGGASGADSAFAKGSFNREIYLPWNGFNGNYVTNHGFYPGWENPAQSQEFVKQFVTNPTQSGKTVNSFMVRNVKQIIGPDFKSPVDFVVCWTPHGKDVGGTGLGLRMAKAYDIPIYNFGHFSSDPNPIEKPLIRQMLSKIQDHANG